MEGLCYDVGMLLTYEAESDEHGVIRLGDLIRFPKGKRVLVTVLDDEPELLHEITLMSEDALNDWNRPEEDEAWAEFQ